MVAQNKSVPNETQFVKLSTLRHTDLNARKHNVDSFEFKKSVIRLARSIATTGLIHNIIVFRDEEIDSTAYFVAAGQRRLMALNYLHRIKAISDDYLVRVLEVQKPEALVMSVTENNEREDMHLSDLLVAINTLVRDGVSAEVIAAKFGYKPKYINKLLKLSHMAPELLDLLKENKISLDQLIALSITDDHNLQLSAWKNASFDKLPRDLRRLALNEEEPLERNKFIKLVGVDSYKAAGGDIKHDLFTQHQKDGGYITNPALVKELAFKKLQEKAEKIASTEGWAWSGSQERLETWGDDKKRFDFPCPNEEDYVFTAAQRAKLDQLYDKIERNQFALEAAEELEGEQKWDALRPLKKEKEALDEAKAKVLKSAKFTDAYKAERGVIVSLDYNGDLMITRGLLKLADKAKKQNKSVTVTEDGQVEDVTQVSAALARSLSCERTLAVQAALIQKPEVALALMVHKLALSAFASGYHSNPVCCTLQHTTRSMINDAPGSDDGIAVNQINQAKAKWEALLPKGWEDDFTLLTTLSIDMLIELQAFCVAVTIDGSVSQYTPGRVNALHKVELAMNFNIHAYWKPTAQNFWGRLKKEAMLDQLNQAGAKVNSEEFMSYKRSDAGKRAETLMEGIQWAPEFI